MKKIMFNDRYGLTQAVLNGKKTQTRRIINCPNTFNMVEVSGFRIARNADGGWYSYLVDEDEREIDGSYLKPAYEIGEVVAVAQCYMSIAVEIGREDLSKNTDRLRLWEKYVDMQKSSGYYNKMFVKSELMPHHIRITNIRIERLQDIGWDDCIKEGILEFLKHPFPKNGEWNMLLSDKVYGFADGSNINFDNPRNAYAALIDKVSGKGTWDSNPYVFVYDFELVD